MLDRYLDALGLRVSDHRDLVEIEAHTDMPVINLLSDQEHPCQAVADLMTVARHKPLPESTITYIGDGNNVCHSLMLAAAMSGAAVRVCTPEGFAPQRHFVEAARSYGSVTLTDDPVEAVSGAGVVYTDVWASMGQEDEAEDRAQVFEPYRVTVDLFSQASADAIFLHCLPAHRGEEVSGDVIDHPRSRVFDQAENRLHAFKAILLHLLA